MNVKRSLRVHTHHKWSVLNSTLTRPNVSSQHFTDHSIEMNKQRRVVGLDLSRYWQNGCFIHKHIEIWIHSFFFPSLTHANSRRQRNIPTNTVQSLNLCNGSICLSQSSLSSHLGLVMNNVSTKMAEIKVLFSPISPFQSEFVVQTFEYLVISCHESYTYTASNEEIVTTIPILKFILTHYICWIWSQHIIIYEEWQKQNQP